MIEFKKLQVKNFMSIGNKPLGYEFRNGEVYLVHGENGSGKSSILLDGLTFALYGNPFRSINNDQIVNSINLKGCSAETEFTIGATTYRVERGMKPRHLNIYENGKLREKESTIPEQQRYLEQNILRMDERTFRQIVVLGSKAYVPFMRLKASHRRTVIEDLLNLSIFSNMGEIIKKKVSILATEAKTLEIENRLVEQSIAETQELLEKVQGTGDTFIVEKMSEIDSTRAEIDTFGIQIEEIELGNQALILTTLSTTEYNGIEDYKDSLTDEKFKIMDMNSQGRALVGKLSKEYTFFEKNKNCPTCHQEIDDSIRDTFMHKAETQIQTMEQGMKKADQKIQFIDQQIASTSLTMRKVAAGMAQIQSIRNEIKNLNNLIVRLNQDILGHKARFDSNAQEFLVKLTDANTRLSEQKARETEIMSEARRLSYIHELVKDGGIRNRIILTYLPLINKLIGKYLDIMESDINFCFDENFNESIKSRHRDNFSYDNFSEGEKLRIDLALLFTFREISRQRNSSATNLVIFDEIGDSSLDSEGFDSFMNILAEEKEKQCVVIISHSPEKIAGKVDVVFEYAKVKNFTVLKNYTVNKERDIA